jgi:hypothetical protein
MVKKKYNVNLEVEIEFIGNVTGNNNACLSRWYSKPNRYINCDP